MGLIALPNVLALYVNAVITNLWVSKERIKRTYCYVIISNVGCFCVVVVFRRDLDENDTTRRKKKNNPDQPITLFTQLINTFMTRDLPIIRMEFRYGKLSGVCV